MKKNQDQTTKYVLYSRTSTRRQNLGLQAQRSTAYAMIPAEDIIAEYSEQESGADNERKELWRAIAHCKKAGATLLVVKCDRLSRDINFASHVIFKCGIQVLALDMPQATTDPLIFGVAWGMAERERILISQRTKAALQEVKKRGVKLGRNHSFTAEQQAQSAKTIRAKANHNPNNIKSKEFIAEYLKTGGKLNYSAIARALTDAGIYTSTGTFHTAQSVKLIIKRFELA